MTGRKRLKQSTVSHGSQGLQALVRGYDIT